MGVKVRDLSELVDTFEAQEGEIQQIIGKTGNGKTYEGTRRALEYLKRGYIVYTTWKLILPDVYDERQNLLPLLARTLFFKSRFYKFDFRKNWHFLDIDRPDLNQYLAGLTDCIVFLDEGQDVFDSRERPDKPTRKILTRTRHMRKTLIIISQRAQAVEVTARANVTYFYRCEKTVAWFWPFKAYFKVYRTEEMDDSNFPIWEERMPDGEMWKAPVWHSHFADQKIYDTYNSWYLRAGVAKSQEVYFEAYDLTFKDKVKSIWRAVFPIKELPPKTAPTGHLAKIKAKSLSTAPKARKMKALPVQWIDGTTWPDSIKKTTAFRGPYKKKDTKRSTISPQSIYENVEVEALQKT